MIDPLVHAATPLAAIRIGDVTGDGVADVVGLEGAVGARSLVVYPQCSSRDLERCRTRERRRRRPVTARYAPVVLRVLAMLAPLLVVRPARADDSRRGRSATSAPVRRPTPPRASRRRRPTSTRRSRTCRSPEIAFSAAQAYRRLYRVDPDPHFVHRAIELYRAYLARVTTGGRVGDAADNLAEMERELDKLKIAGKDIARSRRDARDAERTRLGVGVAISDPAAGDATAVREIGDAAGAPIRGLAAMLDGKPLEPFALVDVTAGRAPARGRRRRLLPRREATRVVAGQAQLVEVELRPRPARVAVTTEADAHIAVDGRPVADAPTPPLALAAGKHLVTIGDAAASRSPRNRRGPR